MDLLSGLNEPQREAASVYEGPLLILAGAGSGKTRVLTHRIAWLIQEKGVDPWNILAITFTNKAAGEMKERVSKTVGFGGESVWVATFHSTCARILRRFIGAIGYDTNFSIYDTDDVKTVIKECCRKLQIDTKVLKERAFMSAISSAKNEMITPEEYESSACDYFSQKTAAVYKEYQKALKASNALDFDDLLCLTVEVFQKAPDVLDYYRNRFKFILVDEYQDTNTVQFELVRLLAGKQANLCVVGDDDQSIYRFRGANIRNILSFEKVYPSAKVIKLEQNYRSTQAILDAANAVIANNRGRKSKTLWTANERGETVGYNRFNSAYEEAEFIARDIARRSITADGSYGDFAILYRTNAQSRLLEEKLLMANIPYKLVGGVNFYARKEIKDLLSYLKIVDNGADDVAARRIINVPKRGLGPTSLTRVQNFADAHGLSFYDALTHVREIPGMGRYSLKVEDFTLLIRSLRTKEPEYKVSELLQDLIRLTGYVEELKAEGTDEAKDRIANIDELISKVVSYEEGNEEASLRGFLQEVSLVADIDALEDDAAKVTLMTMHAAKGLEFPQVYIAGMEENVFPSYMSLTSDSVSEDIEEERRLCYVGMTRAQKRLTLTSAMSRMLRGQMQYNRESRFIQEIPENLLTIQDGPGVRRPSGNRFGSGFGNSGGFGGSGSYGGSNSFGSAGSYGGSSSYGSSNSYAGAGGSGSTGSRKSGTTAYDLSAYKVKKASTLDYEEGDLVKHIKFGKGTVKSIVDGGRDFEVTVEFEGVAGTKKMFASFAKLKKVEE